MPVWIYVKHPFLNPIMFLKKDDCDLEILVTEERARCFYLGNQKDKCNP